MKSLRLKWEHKNRIWIYATGELKGEPLYYGFDRVVTALTRKLGAVIARDALHSGCHLLMDKIYFPDCYPFSLSKKDIGGGWYVNEELGKAWIPCEKLVGCSDTIYINLEVP